jgi:hypothetical protein
VVSAHFRAVLLKPLDQQADRDGNLIDPAGVRFDPDEEHVIFREYSYNVPEDVMGRGKVSRAEDGSLWVEGVLEERFFPDFAVARGDFDTKHQLGGGYMAGRMQRGAITTCSLASISVIRQHVDPTQPTITIRRSPQ